jgi:predicted RNA binding protein YcfA (HicA-like mRNA interferase family)
MTAKEAIDRLTREGWVEVRQRGSHKQFKHRGRVELITVPVHKGDLPTGIVADIKRKAGW